MHTWIIINQMIHIFSGNTNYLVTFESYWIISYSYYYIPTYCSVINEITIKRDW